MLGDVNNSDASYSGDTSLTGTTFAYFRDKATQFQAILNAVDSAAQVAQTAIENSTDDAFVGDMVALLSDYDAKKTAFKVAAEGINAGAAVINGMGGRFPVLSIPAGLGFVPFVVPAATVAALGAAAALIVWGNTWLQGVNARLLLSAQSQASVAAANEISDPAMRDRALAEASRSQAAAAEVQAAADAANASPLSSVAGIVKWAALGLAAWMAYSAFRRSQRDD